MQSPQKGFRLLGEIIKGLVDLFETQGRGLIRLINNLPYIPLLLNLFLLAHQCLLLPLATFLSLRTLLSFPLAQQLMRIAGGLFELLDYFLHELVAYVI